eukprot:gene12031-14072_t
MTKGKKRKSVKKEDEFMVEQILARKIVDGKTYYLIKWETYPRSESTWEDSQNVFCDELITKLDIELKDPDKEADQIVAEQEFPFVFNEPSNSDLEDDSPPMRREKKTKQQPTKSSSKSSSSKASSSSASTARSSGSPSASAKKKAPEPPTYSKASNNSPSMASESTRQNGGDLYSDHNGNDDLNSDNDDDREPGFQNGDTVETILGCKELDEISFYVKWTSKESYSYVPSSILRYKEPQKVIEFLQSRIQFDRKTGVTEK